MTDIPTYGERIERAAATCRRRSDDINLRFRVALDRIDYLEQRITELTSNCEGLRDDMSDAQADIFALKERNG